MPQKRNPDVAELARGKSARLVGNLTGMLTLLKGLPTGYNRDLQEDKESLFDTVDTLLLTLPAVAGAVGTATLDTQRMRADMDAQLAATDLADYLVRRGVPFRTSHEVVGRLVRRAEVRGVPLTGLELTELRAEHEAFDADVREVFDWETSTDARDVEGGTSSRAVREQLAEAARRLEELRGGGA
jgi:argininosuccinate lyase